MMRSKQIRDGLDEPLQIKDSEGSACRTRLRILFVCSSGGHLSQLLALRSWSCHHSETWVTFQLPDAIAKLAQMSTIWAHHPTTRNPRNFLRNLYLAWTTLRYRRPDVIISSGAAVAVPFFVVGRLLGIPTLYIEVFDRIDSRTLSGRLCRPLSTRFCVQLEAQQMLYPGSIVVGPLV